MAAKEITDFGVTWVILFKQRLISPRHRWLQLISSSIIGYLQIRVSNMVAKEITDFGVTWVILFKQRLISPRHRWLQLISSPV
jgi:hypothetical protein